MATTTELMRASAHELQLEAKRTEAIACLPSQLLYIASQFTSRDESKKVLQHIHVFTKDGLLQIESTDGHRAFRALINNSEGDFDTWYCDGSLLILRSAFNKRLTYGNFAIFKHDGTVDILGGKPSRTNKTIPTNLIESRPWKAPIDWSFPNIGQLFPDKFSNMPGAPISWNARYLAEFMTEAARYSTNGIAKMETNTPVNPLIFSSDCCVYGCENVRLEYLLCPVQARTR